MPKAVSSQTYPELLKEIRTAIQDSKQTVERAVVVMYWSIGRAINTYTKTQGLSVKDGITVYEKLEQDLSIDTRMLYQASRFHKVYPKIDTSIPLSWSHYRYLVQIKPDNKREQWQRRIVRDGLSVKDFLILSKEGKGAAPVKGAALQAQRGLLYHYRVVKIAGRFFVDVGFENYIEPPDSLKDPDNTRVYRSAKEDGVYKLYLSKACKEEIYTYPCTVERVVDADTLDVLVDCGFGIRHKERLRLRGIDAPEVSTIKGTKAKRFVEGIFKKCRSVAVKTYKADKYGRYLADIFIGGTEDVYQAAAEGVLLNQTLLDKGFAEVWK